MLYNFAHGVFESLRAYRDQFFLEEAHLERLFESAHSLGWRLPFSREAVLEMMRKECKRLGLDSSFVRVTIYRDWERVQYEVSVIVTPPKEYPMDYFKRGVSLVSVPTRRNRVNVLDPQIKSNNVLPGVLAIEEARLNGAFEALQLNSFGYVSEGTVSNLFMVRDGACITPPTYVGVLKGVTRDLVIRLARQLNLGIQEIPFTRHELYNARECFLTNTSMGIMPVREVDERAIGGFCPGPLTQSLMGQWDLFLREWEGQVLGSHT